MLAALDEKAYRQSPVLIPHHLEREKLHHYHHRTRRFFSVVAAICLIALVVIGNSAFDPSFVIQEIQRGVRTMRPVTVTAGKMGLDVFHWGPCEGVSDRRFKCGYLDVPLDYTNKSDTRTIRLATNLFQAGKKKSKNTIITNPGGPGGSGTASLYTRGPYVSQNLTDGKLDVLGFDPRGVNMSEPSLSCFPNDVYRDRWSTISNQYRETAFTTPMYHLQTADAMAEATMQACAKQWGDIPRFLSTAFVARDVDSIRQALGEDEIWGYMVSYGTGIGTHISQLFPDRIGRLLLDGLEFVKDHRELGGFGWTSLDNVTDAWHDGFLGECIRAGPDRCALAASDADGNTTTLESLSRRMSSLLQQLLRRPLPAYAPSVGPGIVTYEHAISIIYDTLYNAEGWPKTAKMLAELEKGNTTLAFQAVNAKLMHNITYSINAKRASSDELGMLVICADSYDAPPKPIEWWNELQANMTEKSFISGNSRLFDVLPCRHFHWDVAEVYRGNFDASLKNPLLLLAETYDPATPLRNGRRLAEVLGEENAHLVVHHGYGHSSRDRSTCTEAIKRAYFLNGTLPDGKETNCYADTKPYPDPDSDTFSHQDWLQLFSDI